MISSYLNSVLRRGNRAHRSAASRRRLSPRSLVGPALAVSLLVALPVVGSFLGLVDVLRNGVNGVRGLDGISDLAVSRDGRFVLAVSDRDDSVAVFEREPMDGVLTFAGLVEDEVDGVFGLEGASAVALSPDGYTAFVTSAIDDSLVIFRLTGDGRLEPMQTFTNGVGGVFGLDGAKDVAVTEDGLVVAVASERDDAVSVFTRNATSEDLVFTDLEQHGFGGVQGLRSAASLAFARNEKRLLVTSDEAPQLTIFSRDATIDSLELLQNISIAGLEGAASVVSYGSHAYLSFPLESTVVALRLSEPWPEVIDVERLGVAGVSGIRGATKLSLTVDGTRLLVAGEEGDSIASFERLPNGQLHFERSISDDEVGFYALRGPAAVEPGPLGCTAYAAAKNSDSLTTLSLSCSQFSTGFETGDFSRFSWR